MKKYCVYKHIRLDTNQIFYIGIGSLKRSQTYKCRNKYWNNVVNKNNGNFKIEILFENLTWEEACEKEKEFIKLYGRKDLGLGTLVNLTDGGEGNPGWIVSEDTKKKQSLAKINKKRTLESRKKQSLSTKGISKKPLSKKHKINLSNSIKGRKITLEQINKFKQTMLNRTDEQKQITRNKYKETYKNFSLEKRKEISLKQSLANSKGQVEAFDFKTNEFIGEFLNMKEASIVLKVSACNISLMLSGKRKRVKNYIFKFKN